MKIAMVGSGYVGLVSGACFADFGHDVVCIDKDQSKIDRLHDGVMPIYEPGLDSLVENNVRAGRLSFTTDLAEAMLPGCEVETVGIRPGEKLHEVMVPRDDARTTMEFDTYYVIEPAFQFWDRNALSADGVGAGKLVTEEFEYDSSTKSTPWSNVIQNLVMRSSVTGSVSQPESINFCQNGTTLPRLPITFP